MANPFILGEEGTSKKKMFFYRNFEKELFRYLESVIILHR